MGGVRNISLIALFVGCLLYSAAYPALAAPHPASGSSALVSAEKGLFWLPKGFSVKTENTSWQLSDAGKDGSKISYLTTKSPKALLSVQTDSLKTDLKLEDYAKRWVKDYSLYGFDILGTKVFTHNGQKSLVIDLLQKKQRQQLRQVLFLKNKKIVVITCQDEEKKFPDILAECNQVAKSFDWMESSRQKAF